MVHLSTPSLLGCSGRKTSLRLLNNSLSIFVAGAGKITLLQMSGEKSAETVGFLGSILKKKKRKKMGGQSVLEALLQENGSLGPPAV